MKTPTLKSLLTATEKEKKKYVSDIGMTAIIQNSINRINLAIIDREKWQKEQLSKQRSWF